MSLFSIILPLVARLFTCLSIFCHSQRDLKALRLRAQREERLLFRRRRLVRQRLPLQQTPSTMRIGQRATVAVRQEAVNHYSESLDIG